MIVAGGCYRELCDLPYWNETFGSGGRAAAVISALGGKVRLKTYYNPSQREDLYTLDVYGVAVELSARNQDIVFAYRNPLSEPLLVPNNIQMCESIRASARSILRFGFIEGDAIVEAKQAVYDPQGSKPAFFAANGSRAERLAVILNEVELKSLEQADDMTDAARRLLRNSGAETVVVKLGVTGALVFEAGREPSFIPAFDSERVFKIGTGDVFTGAFAYHWCESEKSATDSASLASQAVSYYAETRNLRIQFADRRPILSVNARIAVASSGNSLPDRLLSEEAESSLRSLGADVARLPSGPVTGSSFDAILVLTDENGDGAQTLTAKIAAAGIPAVVLTKGAPTSHASTENTFYTDDFATAIYKSFWIRSNKRIAANREF
jgi:hypothetical protein